MGQTMNIDIIEKLRSENRKTFNELLNLMDEDGFRKAPKEDAWPAAAQFHHIYLAKKRIAGLVKGFTQGLQNTGDTSVTEVPVREIFGEITYDQMPDLPAPGTEPDSDLSKVLLMTMMEAVCTEMDGYFEVCKTHDCSAMTAKHPFVGLLNCYEWFYFEGIHERSHLGHIRSEYL